MRESYYNNKISTREKLMDIVSLFSCSDLKERSMKFQKDFIFGTATSSYQIEGGRYEGGRTDSIWDVFSHTPGKVHNNETGDQACDHYHLYQKDIDLMAELGIDSYRFSIAWPRIFPEKGRYNPEGMAFYKELIAYMKSKGIQPSVTLYHWDLPQWVEDEGGWTNRKSVTYFLDYAKMCFDHLGSDVDLWITHNEPFCAGILGYMTGHHAPGLQDKDAGLCAIHHLLLSHGKTVELFRDKAMKGKIGITLNHSPVIENNAAYSDQIAASNFDGWMNRWFLDPVFKGAYPLDMINLYDSDMSFVQAGDLQAISQPLDFFGINYYHASKVAYDHTAPLRFKSVEIEAEKTMMDWPVTPEGLKQIIRRLRADYTSLPIYITENGAAFDDQVTEDGQVLDDRRCAFLQSHLEMVSQLNDEGMNIQGYYLWSFLDNFEWAHGYEKRFGIVYVDFESLVRIPKASYYLYQNIIQSMKKEA